VGARHANGRQTNRTSNEHVRDNSKWNVNQQRGDGRAARSNSRAPNNINNSHLTTTTQRQSSSTMKLLLFPFPSFVVVAGLLLSVPSSTASTVSLAGSSKDRVHHDGGDDGLRTATRRHRQLLPLSVPGLIHLCTGDSPNANDSIGAADSEVGTNTKFVAMMDRQR